MARSGAALARRRDQLRELVDDQVRLDGVGSVVEEPAIADRDKPGLTGARNIRSFQVAYVPYRVSTRQLELVQHVAEDLRRGLVMTDFVGEGPALEVMQDPGTLEHGPQMAGAGETDIADDPQLHTVRCQGGYGLSRPRAQLQVHSFTGVEIGGEDTLTIHGTQAFDRIRELNRRLRWIEVLPASPVLGLQRLRLSQAGVEHLLLDCDSPRHQSLQDRLSPQGRQETLRLRDEGVPEVEADRCGGG